MVALLGILCATPVAVVVEEVEVAVVVAVDSPVEAVDFLVEEEGVVVVAPLLTGYLIFSEDVHEPASDAGASGERETES